MREELDTLALWLDGRPAGRLLRGENGDVEFIYDTDYLNDQTTTPLSVSMQKDRRGYGPDRVMPWLSNLLPDAVEVRDRWAAKFGEQRNDPFTLLRHMGQDAPGSVQVVPEGVEPVTAGVLAPISEARIAERIAGIMVDPDHWVDDSDEDESRFSLGGNQGKFALARMGSSWFEPNGRAASTHIVKPGMATATGVTNAEVQAVEFVTMRAAGAVGIPTATVEILRFAGIHAFVTTRYDRRIQEDGSVLRIHQEDFCQALSIRPSRKYEADGGPTMVDASALVGEASSSIYREHDLSMFARLAGFNLLIAGVDAHAKNHSLLLAGQSVRLAPAYDLISAHGIWDEDRVRYRAGAAMKYGKRRRYRNITGRDLARAADALRADRTVFLSQLHDLAAGLPDAFEKSIAELPAELAGDNVLRMPGRLRSFTKDILGRVTDADIIETPALMGAIRSSLYSDPRTWKPGHRGSDGTWRTGHYTNRTNVRRPRH